MKPTQVTDPQEPDTVARIAGKDIYGTTVGALRRIELWKLGNCWGMEFPVGASKDYMLPFFMRLEAEGKNPMKPPGVVINSTGDLRSRDIKYTGTHVEKVPADFIQPAPMSEFEAKLHKLHHGQLKKMCKMRGIPQTVQDRKVDLIARIIAATEGNEIDQDIAGRGE